MINIKTLQTKALENKNSDLLTKIKMIFQSPKTYVWPENRSWTSWEKEGDKKEKGKDMVITHVDENVCPITVY